MIGTLERELTSEDFKGVLLSDFSTPELIRRYFAHQVVELLKEWEWTIDELARRVRVDANYLTDVLSGEHEIPYELAEDIVFNIHGPSWGKLLPFNPLSGENEEKEMYRRIKGEKEYERMFERIKDESSMDWILVNLAIGQAITDYAFPVRDIPEEFIRR